MSQKHTINYKTYSELMYDIEDDLSTFTDQGHIDRDKYIKIVQKCNSFLSVKINPEREVAIDIVGGRGKLPNNFKILEFAFICTKFKEYTSIPGVEIHYEEEITPVTSLTKIKEDCVTMCGSPNYLCNKDKYNCTPYQVWRKSTNNYIEVSVASPVRLVNSQHCKSGCINSNIYSLYEINIIKEKDRYYINAGFDEGVIYVSYVAEMLTEDNDILILDHPLVTEYYEYAVKERIYEDLWLNGLDQVQNKMKLMIEKHMMSKREAKRFVSMSDFEELKTIHFDNRKRHELRYFTPIV